MTMKNKGGELWKEKAARFGEDINRKERIKKTLEKSFVSHIESINSPYDLADKILSTDIFNDYCIGCIVDEQGDIGENPKTLLGLCCEEGYPSLTYYPALKMAKEMGLKTNVIIPTYEYSKLKLRGSKELEDFSSNAKNVIRKFGFEAIDTINDKKYRQRRNERMLDILSTGKYGFMDAAEMSDCLLMLEEKDTIAIIHNGFEERIIEAKKIAKDEGIENKLSAIVFFEPNDLSGKNAMYHGAADNKIFIGEEPKSEAKKIANAVTSGSTLEQFKKQGGDYFTCPVGEIYSLVSGRNGVYDNCINGSFSGCAECKRNVQHELEGFLGEFYKNVN